MPLLDVSEVLFDPDFADDTLICRRSTQTIDVHGRPQFTSADETFTGVVVPTKSLLLERLAESEVQRGSVTCITTYRLTTGGGSTEADILVWQGTEYTVVNTDDWSTYGAGFIAATCNLKPLNPP